MDNNFMPQFRDVMWPIHASIMVVKKGSYSDLELNTEMYGMILHRDSPASKTKYICIAACHYFKPGDIWINEITMTSCQMKVFRITNPFYTDVLMAATIGPNKRWLSNLCHVEISDCLFQSELVYHDSVYRTFIVTIMNSLKRVWIIVWHNWISVRKCWFLDKIDYTETVRTILAINHWN